MTDSLTIKSTPSGPDGPPPAEPNRPAWLPAKFKSAEDFAAAYTELEKRQGAGDPPANSPAAKTADLSTEEAAKAALTAQGLDFKALTKEYSANGGKLTDESMASLKAKGFSEDQVKQFAEGREAVARENVKGVHDSVGGAERFSKLQDFAAKTFDAKEIDAYNAAIVNGDYATVRLMLKGLNVQFEKTFGKDGNLTAGREPNTTPNVYQNFQDYRTAMSDPRYAKDRNYREAVDQKLERSMFYKRSR